MKLIGTSTTPARAVAKVSTAYCQQLRDNRATRSPRKQPVVLQGSGRSVHQVIELGEAQGDIAVDDGDLVELLACRPAGDVGEAVTAGPRL